MTEGTLEQSTEILETELAVTDEDEGQDPIASDASDEDEGQGPIASDASDEDGNDEDEN